MKQLYEQHTAIDPKLLSKKIKEFLKEDRADQDITTTHLSNNDQTKSAHIIAEEKMVFAGEQILQNIFKNNKYEIKVKDSMKCNAGDVIAVVSATSGFLLTRERVMLNLLQRLSGIAKKLARRKVIIIIQYDRDISTTTAPAKSLKTKPVAIIIISKRNTSLSINE